MESRSLRTQVWTCVCVRGCAKPRSRGDTGAHVATLKPEERAARVSYGRAPRLPGGCSTKKGGAIWCWRWAGGLPLGPKRGLKTAHRGQARSTKGAAEASAARGGRAYAGREVRSLAPPPQPLQSEGQGGDTGAHMTGRRCAYACEGQHGRIWSLSWSDGLVVRGPACREKGRGFEPQQRLYEGLRTRVRMLTRRRGARGRAALPRGPGLSRRIVRGCALCGAAYCPSSAPGESHHGGCGAAPPRCEREGAAPAQHGTVAARSCLLQGHALRGCAVLRYRVARFAPPRANAQPRRRQLRTRGPRAQLTPAPRPSTAPPTLEVRICPGTCAAPETTDAHGRAPCAACACAPP